MQKVACRLLNPAAPKVANLANIGVRHQNLATYIDHAATWANSDYMRIPYYAYMEGIYSAIFRGYYPPVNM